MATVKVPRELVELTLYGDSAKEQGLEFVKSGSWEADGKYQTQDIWFRYNGQLLYVYQTRSGSPFSDYFYEYEWEKSDEFVDCEVVDEIDLLFEELTPEQFREIHKLLERLVDDNLTDGRLNDIVYEAKGYLFLESLK